MRIVEDQVATRKIQLQTLRLPGEATKKIRDLPPPPA
jgi:hypothetical protein